MKKNGFISIEMMIYLAASVIVFGLCTKLLSNVKYSADVGNIKTQIYSLQQDNNIYNEDWKGEIIIHGKKIEILYDSFLDDFTYKKESVENNSISNTLESAGIRCVE